MSFDWTKISDDPNNRAAKDAAKAHLLQLRRVHMDRDVLGFVVDAARGKRVLDIGVVSHSARYFEQPDWRHGRIHKVASRCVGIDILEDLVRELNQRGFDVRCVDATSEADIGERFDLVFLGDVLEHVENPAALLRFAGRHLAPGGRILGSTPSPFSRKFFRRFRRDGTPIVNLDHLCWITPSQALELGRRSALRLVAYHLIKPIPASQRWWKGLTWRFSPLEYSFPDYVYEFAPAAEVA